MMNQGKMGIAKRFPGILQIKQRADAEGFYLSKDSSKAICGLFIRTQTPLAKGERVLTAVTLPETEEPIFVECEVVWIKNGNGSNQGMAVKFTSITEPDRRKLDQFFRTKPPAQ